jgi:hypothetical protein
LKGSLYKSIIASLEMVKNIWQRWWSSIVCTWDPLERLRQNEKDLRVKLTGEVWMEWCLFKQIHGYPSWFNVFRKVFFSAWRPVNEAPHLRHAVATAKYGFCSCGTHALILQQQMS